jgi:tetratricopeptide (TPR) repeat protein
VISTGTRGGTAGFGINVTPWQYALTQFEAITRYLSLSFWPHPLIFDYGAQWVRNPTDALPYAILVVGLIFATLVAWWRAPKVAWLALLFFAVLSPTSSIVPGNRQTLAEHRMYLPLAPVLTLAVCGFHLAMRGRTGKRIVLAATATTAVAFAVLTVRRNIDYRSEIALYEDTAVKRPANGFAHYNLAKVYAESGRHEDALREYEQALRLIPDSPGIQYNWGNSLTALGRNDEAIARQRDGVSACR